MGAHITLSCAEKMLRKTLEKELGEDLSGKKELIRAEVGGTRHTNSAEWCRNSFWPGMARAGRGV